MKNNDPATRWTVLFLAFLLLLIAGGSIWAPVVSDTDKSPTTYNSGSAGTRAAYLLLNKLGYRVSRWEKPTANLSELDAAHTTLVLANPFLQNEPHSEESIARFLKGGGRVLATGFSGALMLPESHPTASQQVYTALCLTQPGSLGPMGRAGTVEMSGTARWLRSDSEANVQQWCGNEPVVVTYRFGQGEVVWWGSPMPLSNRGLRSDGSLKLLLASVGGRDRTVIFDEYVHGIGPENASTLSGMPLWALLAQLCGVALLTLWSFSRRRGPVRDRAPARRTSPVEFALSMGGIYERAHATQMATGAARQRLHAFLENDAGLPREVVRTSPEALANTVATRFNCNTESLAADLRLAELAESTTLSGRSALALVVALDAHVERLRRIAAPQKGAVLRRHG